MMSVVKEKDFVKCHEVFDRDHARLRSELMASLPQRDSDVSFEPTPLKHSAVSHRSRIWRAVAVAAAVVVALGLLNVLIPNSSNPVDSIVTPVANAVTPQTAWANALQYATEVSSIHMVMTTPRPNGEGSSVEMWWRRPHDFRMKFNTGLVMTGNGEMRCTSDPSRNSLTIHDASAPGLEMAILGEVGEMFASPYTLSSQWMQDAQAVAAEDTFYRGEQCRQITVQRDSGRYEYLIDKNTNMIYQGARYSDATGGRVLCWMEVISVDNEMPDSLFYIEPTEGIQINDRRTNAQ